MRCMRGDPGSGVMVEHCCPNFTPAMCWRPPSAASCPASSNMSAAGWVDGSTALVTPWFRIKPAWKLRPDSLPSVMSIICDSSCAPRRSCSGVPGRMTYTC
eukprot:6470560-Amphidinium_carterae.1